ncbi:MAG: RNA polymerase sigma factor [Limisphaerales bacterium]
MRDLVETEDSLEQLAAKARAGCSQSFELIIEQTKDRLFSYLMQLVGNQHDAEDLTQEALVKAFRNIHTFDGRARFTTWLYTIAKNTAFSQMRKRRWHQPIEDFAEVLTAEGSVFSEGDEARSIWRLARQLKPAFFETLWLFYAEGFSLKETAAIMKTNPITVRVNLHRARSALRKKLERSSAGEWRLQ